MRVKSNPVTAFLILKQCFWEKKSSQKSCASSRSSKSSTSSAHIQAEAERAALEACAPVFKEKHALEEQTEELRRRKKDWSSIPKLLLLLLN